MKIKPSDKERLKQAHDLLREIAKSLYYGEDLKDDDIREFYSRVYWEIKKDIAKLLEK